MSTHLRVVTDDYVRDDVCGPCGGRCCKGMPGAASPEDFGAPNVDTMRRMLKERLSSGRWSVDWWEGDVTGRGQRHASYFLRPATVDGVGSVYDASWGGACCFHTPAGCGIFAERPMGCRGLEPGDDGCTPRYGQKEAMARAWVPYEALVVEVANWVDGRDVAV